MSAVLAQFLDTVKLLLSQPDIDVNVRCVFHFYISIKSIILFVIEFHFDFIMF